MKRTVLCFHLAVMLLCLSVQPALANDADVFPAPLPGWTAGDVFSQKKEIDLGLFTLKGQAMTREYFNQQGEGIGIQIDTLDCPGAGTIKAYIDDPEQVDRLIPGSKVVNVKGYDGLDIATDDGGRMVSILVKGCTLVHVGGPRPPAHAIDAYLDRLDFERIKDIAN